MSLKPVISGLVSVPTGGSTFDPASPGPIGGNTPAAGTFTLVFLPNICIRTGSGGVEITDSSQSSFLSLLCSSLTVNGGIGTYRNTTSFSTPSNASEIGASNGVMSVINDGEATALPITRTVGTALYNSGGSVNGGSNSPLTVTVTGAISTDTVIANFTSVSGFAGAGGGLVIVACSISAGTVTITVANTDLISANNIPNISVKIIR